MRLVSVPVSAGFPSPAADDLEDEIDPIAWIVRYPTSTFWCGSKATAFSTRAS
jgi:DNA polymerase V